MLAKYGQLVFEEVTHSLRLNLSIDKLIELNKTQDEEFAKRREDIAD